MTIVRQWKEVRALMRRSFDAESPGELKMAIGAFGDLGGAIYALTHLGVLWSRPRLLDEAEELVELLDALIEQDVNYDVVGGAAGWINILLGLYDYRPSRHILRLAIRCGDHLLAHARTREQGIGWLVLGNSKPLAGFAHGAAGISQALLRLAALTKERRFQSAASKAIAYERSVFSSEADNWLDLRDSTPPGQPAQSGEESQFMVAWCHGAPGIGLSRLSVLGRLDDQRVRGEVETALSTTFRDGLELNHSLCHGTLGNLELPLEINQRYGNSHLCSQVHKTAAGVLRDIEEHGWLCATPSGVETPGLMLGLAGIGYGLLRVAEPRRVPSVLTLSPPKICRITLLGVLCSALVAGLQDKSADWPSVWTMIKGVGAGWLILAAWAALGIFLATLFRGASLAIGVGLAYALVIEGLALNLPIKGDTFDSVRNAFLGKNATDLAHSFGSLPQGLLTSSASHAVDPTQAVLVMLAYMVAFLVISVLLFQRRDV